MNGIRIKHSSALARIFHTRHDILAGLDDSQPACVRDFVGYAGQGVSSKPRQHEIFGGAVSVPPGPPPGKRAQQRMFEDTPYSSLTIVAG